MKKLFSFEFWQKFGKASICPARDLGVDLVHDSSASGEQAGVR